MRLIQRPTTTYDNDQGISSEYSNESTPYFGLYVNGSNDLLLINSTDIFILNYDSDFIYSDNDNLGTPYDEIVGNISTYQEKANSYSSYQNILGGYNELLVNESDVLIINDEDELVMGNSFGHSVTQEVSSSYTKKQSSYSSYDYTDNIDEFDWDLADFFDGANKPFEENDPLEQVTHKPISIYTKR